MNVELLEINPEILNKIKEFQQESNISPDKLIILDYGCGSGRAILALRLLGYQSYGVDIDKKAISEGKNLLREHGFDGESLLLSCEENKPIPYPDGMFKFIFSQEVLEHVSDLSSMSSEIRRVSAPGSKSFHVFRPQFTFMEQHFFMPLVHWLPKNKIRRFFIMAFSCLGVGMRPPEIPNAGPFERAEFLYNYSINQTFYRPYKDIGSAFVDKGFMVSYPATDHRKIKKSQALSAILHIDIINSLFVWLISTFLHGYIMTTAPGDVGQKTDS